MEKKAQSIIIKMVAYHSDEYKQMVQLRYDVLRAPLGQHFSAGFLAKDAGNMLIGAFVNNEIIGCCQLEEKANGVYQFRQMAVSNQLQSGGIGTKIIHFAENFIRERGATRITLHGRESATSFYRKLGYAAIGNPFMEIGLPHIEMVKDLEAF